MSTQRILNILKQHSIPTKVFELQGFPHGARQKENFPQEKNGLLLWGALKVAQWVLIYEHLATGGINGDFLTAIYVPAKLKEKAISILSQELPAWYQTRIITSH